jgi:amidase
MLPTLTTVSTDGAFRISRSFDGIGGMAKTPADLASLTETILLPQTRRTLSEGSYRTVMNGSWDGMKVGVVENTWGGADPGKWATEPVVSRSVIIPRQVALD